MPRIPFLCLLLIVAAPTRCQAVPEEEFVGPFPSWRNLQRDYGAQGDGKTDDTAAVQKALDDLVKHQKACVLYVPAGMYRLTHMVKTVRKVHTDCQGVAIIGADPSTTILKWDGPKGGTMFQWDAWYSKISRLTLDGSGRADVCLLYGPSFSTYNETSDITFRGAKTGLMFGGPQTNGQAENEVLRCRFIGCDNGLMTINWNSMDIWIWYSRFEDCGRAIHNIMGNWHVWHCLFLRSKQSDMSTANLMVFSVVGNTSVGSRRFFDFSTGHTWGSPVSLTGNRILNPTGDWAVVLDNAGPYLVVDNVFRLSGKTRGVRMTWGDQVLAGNVYTRSNAVQERGRFRRVVEKTVRSADVSTDLPRVPPTPPQRERRVFEVKPGSDGEAIQRAIDAAARYTGQRPGVHLAMGAYKITKTLIIPAGCDVQLIGDGAGETATRLNWAGPAHGTVLRLEGPSRATLRDFYINAGQAQAVLVADADQRGGRIFADQLSVNGPTANSQMRAAALRVRGLEQSDVLLRALQGSGNAGTWVDVVGGPNAEHATNQVSIFTGATGSAVGQYNLRHGGRLVVRGVYHERSTAALSGLLLNGSGTLSIDATRFSYATSPKSPMIDLDSFRGLFTLATSLLMPVETKAACRIDIRGNGGKTRALAIADLFWVTEPGTTADTVWQNRAKPPARGGLLNCNINTSNKKAAPSGFAFLANVGDNPDPARSRYGSGPLADRGGVDNATILRHLAPLRAARVWLPDNRPTGVTDVRMHRVMATGGGAAVVEFRAK